MMRYKKTRPGGLVTFYARVGISKKFLCYRILLFILCFAIAFPCARGARAADIHIDTSSPFIYPEYSKKISMDFQDALLVNVLKIFSRQSDLNLITSEDIADKRVTVYLDNVSVDEALEQVLRANNLTYEIQGDSDIYIIKPSPQPAVELITRVYRLKHAAVSSSKIRKTLKIETGAGVEIEADEDAETIGITAAISGILTSDGKIIEDPRTNSLIITDIAGNFPHIERTIARLDVPVVQILIELEMLEVTKGTADLIGLKIGSTPLTFTGGQRESLFPWNEQMLRGRERIDAPNYTMGTLNASGLTATLQFIRTQTDTKTLARPRILTLNHEPAQIKIATDEAIGSATNTSSSEGTSTQSVEAERVETGISLTVTPQANTLTGEIIMAVVPKVTIARTGGTFNAITFKDPEERASQSILRVQSGDTIVIGGLLRTDISNTTTKIPFLGSIPFIGRAFRHNDKSITEKELIIFITPHILDEIPRSRGQGQLPSPRTAQKQEIPFRLKQLKEIEKEFSIIEKQAF